jgi:alpha-L-fucosidase 2
MDQEIVWDHFTNLLEAAEVLRQDDELVRRVKEARERLAWPKIGKDGRLLEWAAEFGETEPEHRHVSHLFAVHPGRQITPRTTPELANAAQKTLRARGDGGTGWSMAWKICFWARLGDGDHALALLRHLLRPTGMRGTPYGAEGAGVYPNLFCSHPPFQIDGNFGGAAGIAELLLQSHDGSVTLLPALPAGWPTGEARGLRARGGLEVDLSWRSGALATAVARAERTGRVVFRYAGKTCELRVEAGKTYDLRQLLS